MIKDFFISFRDNIRQKTTNPFFGTFIIVWTIRNWKLVYSFFTIESHKSLDDRIKYIEQYFSKESFLESLWWTTLWSFGILIASYSLLNLSRLIVNLFEKIITPKIYKLTDRGDIVLKKDYEILLKENEKLKERFEKEREAKIKAQSERDELDARINNQMVADLRNSDETSNEETDERLILNKVLQGEFVNDFGSLISAIAQNHPISFKSPFVDPFSKLGLIEVKREGTYGNYYKFTSLGERVKQLYIREHLTGDK